MYPVFESASWMTQDEFDSWATSSPAQREGRQELLNGRIVMTPPAAFPHGKIESTLGFLLNGFVRPRKLGIVFGSSQGFDLPSGDTVEPDGSWVSPERWA